MKKIIFLIVALAIIALALAGCFRKSIGSAPSPRRPAHQTEPGPIKTPEQEIISETHQVDSDKRPIIEETYELNSPEPKVIDESHDVGMPEKIDTLDEIDAPAEAAMKTPDVGGNDLADEPVPKPEAVQTEAVEQTKEATIETSTEDAFEPVTDPEKEVVDTKEMVDEMASPDVPTTTKTGQYFVQIGAFSDLENANRILARLLSDGYKGSVLAKTDAGMYRVKAGAFADVAAARNALEALKADFPNGFVLKAE